MDYYFSTYDDYMNVERKNSTLAYHVIHHNLFNLVTLKTSFKNLVTV